MDQFSLQEEYDRIEFSQESENVNNFDNLLDNSPFLCNMLSPEKSENQTIQHLLNVNFLGGFEPANQSSKEEYSRTQNQRQGQSYEQTQLCLLAQNILNSGSYKSVTDLSCNSEEVSSKKQKIRKITQQDEKPKKRKRIKKQQKNQYDKNIPGHIVSTVVSQILQPTYKEQIEFYCKKMKTLSENQHITYENITDFATKIKERSNKFGTSQLGHFFGEKQPENDLQKVFGLFMVRFLKQQYILHILRVGKMSNKQKYLECATNMMYIPQLRQEEYQLIHQFYRRDV